MRFLRRILLGLLAIIIVIQLPFIYRRYETAKLSQRITELEIGRIQHSTPGFNEVKGIIHAHTSLGGHSTGGFDELIAAANSNGLDFVLMTEHYSQSYDTAALTLNGKYGQTLFVGGNEIDTSDGDRFLMVPGGADAAGFAARSTPDVINTIHSEGRLALITYPEKFRSWDALFDGTEVFSLHTAAVGMNRLTAPLDILWSGSAYPALTFARYFRRPDANLAKFDEVAARRRITLFAGTDAHSNIGFHVFGDDAGHKFLNIKLDPYAVSFSEVRMHVLLDSRSPLSRETLVDAIREGHFFTGFDAFGDTTGFSFSAANGDHNAIEGDEITIEPALGLKVLVPQPSKIVVFKNGQAVANATQAVQMSLQPDGPGEYRVEVYREGLGPPFDSMPWILSNPIYVR